MPDSLYTIPLERNDGSPATLGEYRGKVLLLVNVASKCGFTPQYEGLEALYERLHAQGFEVLAFPANDFMGQEPGSDAEIREFCSSTYGVTFPLFAKLHVKGDAQHPLYRYLTAGGGDPELAGDIGWNFNKFLVDREGRVIARWGSRTKPEDAELVEAIEKALAG
ncbi:MAG: glutathione peroxidase [Candidatus Krumholzibacteriia bacterium]|nr:glutathione peroxidase [bacterium]MCB9513713.1 glutathione peroxidase [Candidatus Latescibacterota bacterium]MCB9515407.1 glutathione peroxidase [Candidatus Latescibacterota bacterium]